MLQSFSLIALLGIFLAAAGAIWVAGIKLSDTTDVLSQRLGLGQALGGVILLAIATNLPEIAITVSAAASDQMDIAVGNILGGIAIQTLVLVAMDVFGMKETVPLTYKAASLTLVIEGLLVVAVLVVAVMGTQLPSSLIYARVGPAALVIALLWVVGVWLGDAPTKGWRGMTARAMPQTRRTSPRGTPKRRRSRRPAAQAIARSGPRWCSSSQRSSRWSRALCWSAQAMRSLARSACRVFCSVQPCSPPRRRSPNCPPD